MNTAKHHTFGSSRRKAVLALLFMLSVIAGQAQDNKAGKREYALKDIEGSTVIFTFGQSNAANHGQTRYKPENEVFNYFGGKVYEGRDPLAGPTGDGGSVWTRLADKMIDAGLAESVTIVPIAVGATEIACWAEGGHLYDRLTETVDGMLADGLVPDYILWHQGESDNIAGTSAETYVHLFESIRRVFRERGIEAPIYIALASYHPACIINGNGNSEDVRQAQKSLAKMYKDIFPGPDTDKFDRCIDRHDGVHFSSVGLEKHAAAWLKALRR